MINSDELMSNYRDQKTHAQQLIWKNNHQSIQPAVIEWQILQKKWQNLCNKWQIYIKKWQILYNKWWKWMTDRRKEFGARHADADGWWAPLSFLHAFLAHFWP